MQEVLGSMPPCPRIVRGQQSLTPQQEEYARQFAQERIASVLSITAIDESEAEAHLCSAYRVAGLEPPQVRWFDSPMSFVEENMNYHVVFPARPHGVLVESQVLPAMAGRPGLHDDYPSSGGEYRVVPSIGYRPEIHGYLVEPSVRYRVTRSITTSVGARVWDCAMMGSVRQDMAWLSLMGDLVRDSMQASMGNSMGYYDYASASVAAYTDAQWGTVYRFFHEAFEENPLVHFALFSEMVSGYMLGSKEAWLVRKPIQLQFDEYYLHSGSNMCIRYRDGWGCYAWHGVRVPEKLILHPEQITREDWLGERNVEVRRVIQERLGNDRFVELVGGVCIDRGTRGNLIEVDLGEQDPEGVAHYVQVKDASTQRQYYLRVPPSIRRADEAVAWTFDLDEPDYQPKQET